MIILPIVNVLVIQTIQILFSGQIFGDSAIDKDYQRIMVSSAICINQKEKEIYYEYWNIRIWRCGP